MEIFVMLAACPDGVSRLPVVGMMQVEAFGLATAPDLADE
jgi:hypothetical protein